MTPKSALALIALRKILLKTETDMRELAAKSALTPSQSRVLSILTDHGDMLLGDIARMTGLRNATVTALVDRLEARGHVSRRRDETDRRRTWLHIEASGREALSKSPGLVQKCFEARFEQLEDWEQSQLVASLERVARMLDADRLDAGPVIDIGPLDEPCG